MKIVIVRDMWLTGFDAPCLHTMYVDKPMRGHALMQAIARVNRVFRDKDGGLVVDYLGLADQLKQALMSYTAGGGKGKATLDQAEAVAAMLEKHEVVTAMFHGFDYTPALAGPKQLLELFPKAADHILAQENGKSRFVNAVSDLSRGFALAVPHESALAIRDELAFFQEMRSWFVKPTLRRMQHDAEMETAVRQLVSKAVTPAGVVDVFALAGLEKPDISILSDGFLAEVKNMPEKNVAVELLHKLLNDEIQHRSRSELVRSRRFSLMLEEAIRRYTNRAIQAAEVIEQLIQLAKDLHESRRRGEELGLSGYEMAFYEALEVNDSAVKVLGDDKLRDIARELVRQVRASVSIDWSKRETTRAKLRNMVRAILDKYGYPPNKQKMAVDLVLEQAAELSDVWAVQPSLTDMRLRYAALVQRKAEQGLTLAEEREIRDLGREISIFDEPYPARGSRPDLLAAAETPAGWDAEGSDSEIES